MNGEKTQFYVINVQNLFYHFQLMLHGMIYQRMLYHLCQDDYSLFFSKAINLVAQYHLTTILVHQLWYLGNHSAISIVLSICAKHSINQRFQKCWVSNCTCISFYSINHLFLFQLGDCCCRGFSQSKNY